MFKLYNTQTNLASDLSNFFKNVAPDLSKLHLIMQEREGHRLCA